MDILHLYEQPKHFTLLETDGKYFSSFDEFNGIVESLKQKAVRDITGEGFGESQMRFTLDLEIRYGGQINVRRVTSPRLELKNSDDCRQLYDAFEKEYIETFSSLSAVPQNGVDIEHFTLKASVPVETAEFKSEDSMTEDPSGALKGVREVYWNDALGDVKTPIYDRAKLKSCNTIPGLAVTEGDDTNIVISPGWTFQLDRLGNGILRKDGA